MRRDDLCDFCLGAGHHFYLKAERPAWWFCRPCLGTGITRLPGPVTIHIGSAQGRSLKPYPETSS